MKDKFQGVKMIVEESKYKRLTYEKASGTFYIFRLVCHLDYGDMGNDWDLMHRTTCYAIAKGLYDEIPDIEKVVDDRAIDDRK